MTNKTYDMLKFVALICLDAVGALYFALAGIWNLPYAEEIVGTIAAINTCLGVIIECLSKNYKKKSGDDSK